MSSNNEKLIAVFGATGQQGSGVVRALQASSQFKNGQGHKFSFRQIPKELFATLFPGAAEVAEMFSYLQVYTYLGSDSSDRIALANKIAGRQPTKFSTWVRVNVPVQTP